MSRQNDEGHRWHGAPQEQDKADANIVADRTATDKLFSTLQAEAAFQGFEAIQLDDGRYLLCRRGWCKLLRSPQDVARYLGKGWIS